MSNYRGAVVAVLLVSAIGCGGNGSDGRLNEGGGRDGFGDDRGTTPAERTSAAHLDGNMMSLSEEGRAFLDRVLLNNQMEVALGHMAEEKGSTEAVQQLGLRIAADHARATRELQGNRGGDATRLEIIEGATQPDYPGSDLQPVKDRLDGLTGEAFDRAYVDAMVRHHEQTIAEFEQVARSDSPQLRAFAERTLPMLRDHLQLAKNAQQAR